MTVTCSDRGAGLSAEERGALATRARRRLHIYRWILAGFAVVGAAVMAGVLLTLRADLPPGRDPVRLWIVGTLAIVFVSLTFTLPLLVLKRRAREPELLLGADRRTRAAVRRALRDGHSSDARIDELAREAARHQLHLVRGRRRFLPWVLVASTVLALAGMTMTWIGEGFRSSMILQFLGVASFTAVAVHLFVNIRRCRRYLTTAPPSTGDGGHVAQPDRS